MPITPAVAEIMTRRFGHDTLIALATTVDGIPHVRAVNAYYENGSFYIITHAKSGKMRQLAENPHAALCGDWFTGHGIGENMGYVRLHPERMETLRMVFASWYENGHVNEDDPDTVILRIRLTNGVLYSHGIRYDLDFTE